VLERGDVVPEGDRPVADRREDPSRLLGRQRPWLRVVAGVDLGALAAAAGLARRERRGQAQSEGDEAAHGRGR
jgi:hypothetical protein